MPCFHKHSIPHPYTTATRYFAAISAVNLQSGSSTSGLLKSRIHFNFFRLAFQYFTLQESNSRLSGLKRRTRAFLFSSRLQGTWKPALPRLASSSSQKSWSADANCSAAFTAISSLLGFGRSSMIRPPSLHIRRVQLLLHFSGGIPQLCTARDVHIVGQNTNMSVTGQTIHLSL